MSNQPPSADTRIRRRSAQRREREKAELRRTILDAASELFVESGYQAFSMRRLAERIGYTPTTIYLYFANKDALLLEVLHQGFAAFGARLREAYDSGADPVARIEAMGRAYIAFGLAHPAYYRLMFMERGEFLLRPRAEGDDPPIRAFEILQRAATELVEGGWVQTRDATTMAQTLWAGVHGIVALAIATPACDEVQAWKITELYLPAIFRGLAHPGDPRPEDRPQGLDDPS